MSLADEYRRQRAWRGSHLVYPALPIARGDVVLDLGCGVGDQAAALSARGAHVVGLDGNAELLAAARAKNLANATFRQTDLATWSEPSLAAGGLWCSFVAAYFPNFGPALGRWVAALRPGAWVMLVEIDDLFGHEPISRATRARFERFCADALSHGRYDFRMGSKLATYTRAAGLEIVGERTLPDLELAFDGPATDEVLRAWRERFARLKGLTAFLGDEADAVHREFLDTLASPEHRSTARVVAVEAVWRG